MTDALILRHQHGSVVTLSLNHPPVNIVTRELTAALGDALEQVAHDDTVRALVLAGAGPKAFCAGSDIGEFADYMAPGQVVPGKLRRQNEVFMRLDRFPKPTVAAVHGLAFGGGLELALCCDFIVAETGTRFALPELNLGVFPSSGGPMRMTRRVGEGRAKALMLLGDVIEADTALAWGLAHQVVAHGQALAAAGELAERLARRAPLALDLCKQAIALSFEQPMDEAMRRSFALSDRAFSSAECREGVRAFLAKEAPRFETGDLFGNLERDDDGDDKAERDRRGPAR